MISEQEINMEQNKKDIFQKLYETGVYEEPKRIIKYFGNKNQIPLEEEENKIEENEGNNILLMAEDARNYLLFINYENIYIGAVSINDLSRRENFGLNIYSDDCFYIGRWKDNMKEGVGFLKINENLMYSGNFSSNQFNGFGFLYDKAKNNLFFGEFNNGEYSEGIFYNIENEYIYRGKIKDGKKNDNLCSFFDTKKGYLFIGEIIEDEFNKGYVYFTKMKEVNQNTDIEFNIIKIFYFDGLGKNNKVFLNDDVFTGDFYKKLEKIGTNIFEHDSNLKDQNLMYTKFFNDLNALKDADRYYNVDNYNSFKDETCIESEFINYFYNIVVEFQTGQEQMNLKDYENKWDVLKQKLMRTLIMATVDIPVEIITMKIMQMMHLIMQRKNSKILKK